MNTKKITAGTYPEGNNKDIFNIVHIQKNILTVHFQLEYANRCIVSAHKGYPLGYFTQFQMFY